MRKLINKVLGKKEKFVKPEYVQGMTPTLQPSEFRYLHSKHEVKKDSFVFYNDYLKVLEKNKKKIDLSGNKCSFILNGELFFLTRENNGRVNFEVRKEGKLKFKGIIEPKDFTLFFTHRKKVNK